ncbi:MAG: hypothetical protein WDN66_04065 [Candidatus Saccharibacteria bacterium]
MNARSKTRAGFTIVETMIFLAVSGLMFILAIGAMSGKQQQTEFQTSVGTLKSDLNQALSNVADGNFQNQVNGQYIDCSASASGLAVSLGSSFNVDPGCSAIGEIIGFGTNPAGQQNFYLIPVFGCTYTACNTALPNPTFTTNFTDAKTQTYISGNYSDYQSTILPFGLTVDSSNTNTSAIGIFSFTSFADSEGSALSSGSSHVELFPIDSYSPTATPTSIATYVSGGRITNCGTNTVCISGNRTAINPTTLQICVDSGTSDSKSALFSIGGAGNITAVSDQIYNNSGCV